jgi:hypothetical protein
VNRLINESNRTGLCEGVRTQEDVKKEFDKFIEQIQPLLKDSTKIKALEIRLYEPKPKCSKQEELLDIEAGIVFLEDRIKWLESFIEKRKDNLNNTVEKRIIDIALACLETAKKDLKKTIEKHGRTPYTDYVKRITKDLPTE